jgi:cell wall-associated NlpC family hydrolase
MNVVQVRVCRRLAALAAVIMALAGGACASRGSVPRPFPGGPTPPGARSTPETDVRPELSVTASEVVATAMALRGTPYRNGGSEPSQGFDCSGLVQWVFARHGTALPRETRDQYDVGRKIDEDDVQPGDLVFFETVSKGPSHVGIALGGGEFVHAPSSRGVVRVESYRGDYWADRWIGARRLIQTTVSMRLERRPDDPAR